MSLRRWALLLAAASLLPAPEGRAAEKLSKEDKAWLDQVRPIMLADEERTYRELKEKADRAEFQKIFWARRDPNLDTPANEYQAEYEAQRATVDQRFKSGGKVGSSTDCGRLFILLGEPAAIAKGEGSRQSWTFKDHGDIKFAGGELKLELDAGCMLPQGSRLGEQLARLAETKIQHPNLRYPLNAAGRLTTLADQLPKPTPGQALLKAPRQDFPAAVTNAMFLRSPGGATYMAGLLRGEAGAGLATEDVAGKKTARVQVLLQAVDESGKVTTNPDRESLVDMKDDGSFVVSYGMALRPGKYTLNVGVLDPKSGKGSVVSTPVEMPDLGSAGITTSALMALGDIVEGQTTPNDPYSAFTLGSTQFLPRFGNTFKPTDSVTLLAALYNAAADATSGKPNVTVNFRIAKADGKTVAEAEPQTFDTDTATPSVGPVPLTKFAPGKYTAQMKVKDNVSGKEIVRDLTFEVVQ
jgi:GWxTD domain-containing protein